MIPAALAVLIVVASAADTTRPRVVAKGDGYLVHLVPATPSTKDRPGRPKMVTYTRTDTGAMAVLAEGDGPRPLSSFGHDLMSYSWDTRDITAVRADGQRLYVLATHSRGVSTPALGPVGTGTTELNVFWLADGSSVGKWPVTGAGPGGTEPMKPGPDGVVVFGESFRFRGKELVGRLVDTPAAAPGPVLLSSGKGYAIHAVRSLPPTAVGGAGGIAVVYVPFAEGHSARTLLQTGDREEKREKGAGELTTPRVTQTRIVATATDAERLYVLVWHGEWLLAGPGEFVGPLLGKSDDFRLYTFWLADGTELPPVRLKGEMALPAETLRGTQLQPVENGVKAFGRTVTFKGKALAKE